MADKEVIREDESVVFPPLLCNNKDRGWCGTKGNNGLYTAQSFGLRVRAAVRVSAAVSQICLQDEDAKDAAIKIFIPLNRSSL